MSILISKYTRVITQGITGKAGQFHTRKCRDYANGRNCFVAGVHPQKAGSDFEGIPIFGSVKEARDHTGANVSVIYVPPLSAAAAIDEAVDAGMELVICVTKGIPTRDMIRTLKRMEGKRTRLLGPACPGVIAPGEIKIGVVPEQIHKKGCVGIVSCSESLGYEAVSQLRAVGLGESTYVGIGDDSVCGTKLADVLRMFNNDPDTDVVLMVSDVDGEPDASCANWIRNNMTKPVVGFFPGLGIAARRVGQAAPVQSDSVDSAREKIALLEEHGIVVAHDPSDIGGLLRSVLYTDSFWMIS